MLAQKIILITLNIFLAFGIVAQQKKDSNTITYPTETSADTENFKEGEFLIPNAFTPNYDGLNETFSITPKNIKEFICNVYNQHGDLVTTLSSKEEYWDGSFNGYPAPMGLYVYKIDYINLGNQEKKLIGAVELRR